MDICLAVDIRRHHAVFGFHFSSRRRRNLMLYSSSAGEELETQAFDASVNQLMGLRG
jgi:hypothetical protein